MNEEPALAFALRAQMQVGSQHTVKDSVKHVLKNEGFLGFYKGFGVSALNIAVSQVSTPLSRQLQAHPRTHTHAYCRYISLCLSMGDPKPCKVIGQKRFEISLLAQ